MSGRGERALIPWCTSIGVTLAFALGIVLLWVIELESADPSTATPVVDAAAVDRALDRHATSEPGDDGLPLQSRPGL